MLMAHGSAIGYRSGSGYLVRERRAKNRGKILIIRTNEKDDRSVEVANPDLGRAGIEIEGAFLVDLGGGIRRRKNLDANVRCADKDGRVLTNFGTLRSEPGDIDGSDAGGGGKRALGNGFARGEQLKQQSSNLDLPTPMSRSRWGAHEETSVLIGLDAIRQLGELWIGENVGPAGKVKPGLRLKIRELDRNRHDKYYTRREPNA
jgi:hypothetical protein